MYTGPCTRARCTPACRSIDTYTLHRRRVKPRRFRRFHIARYRDLAQVDLADFSNNPDTGHHYLLGLIDVHSRYVWACAIRRKTSSDIITALKLIFKSYKPRNLMSDSESGIMSKACQKFLRTNDVNHYTTNSPTHCPHIERYWRTLKSKLSRYMFAKRTQLWLEAVKKIVHALNRTVTRAHGETPYDVVHDPEATLRADIKMFSYKDYKTSARPLSLGQLVRISTVKRGFQKEGDGGWGNEVFKISRVKRTHGEPIMYLLKDQGDEPIRGAFYRDELQKVKIPKKNKYLIEKIMRRRNIGGVPHVLVRWYGRGAQFDSFIPADRIEDIESVE